MFSPDGRWIAFTSNEGAQPDVYVQPFPADGAEYQVSRNGGSHPVWRGDGKELFYLRRRTAMLMAVPIARPRASSDPGAAQALFNTGAVRAQPSSQQYAVTKDGKRFLVNSRPGSGERRAADRRPQLAGDAFRNNRLPDRRLLRTFSNFTSPGKNGTATR